MIATRTRVVAGKTKGAGAQSTAPRRPTGTEWKAEELRVMEVERTVTAPKMETMSDEGTVSIGNENKTYQNMSVPLMSSLFVKYRVRIVKDSTVKLIRIIIRKT